MAIVEPWSTSRIRPAPSVCLSYREDEFCSPVRPGLGSDRKRQNLSPFGLGTYFNLVSRQEAGPSDYQFSATYKLTCNWTGVGVNLCAIPLAPGSPPLSSSKTENIVQNPLPTPTVIQYGLDVQRQLTATMTLRVGYVGWYGYHQTRLLEADTRTVKPHHRTLQPGQPQRERPHA